jgi:hypothetical protein
MPLQLPGAPPAVTQSLERLKEELLRVAGKNLAGLILYGGLARGRYRAGKSDINIVVLLHDASATNLAAIGPTLRVARRGAGVVPMILTPGEVRSTAVVFPTKFLDIQNHHIVLYGDDLFVGLAASREQIRLRILQQLHNLTLRMRTRYCAAFDDVNEIAEILTSLARPLAVELTALLQLARKEVPPDDRTSAVFKAAAHAFGANASALERLAGLRHGQLVGEDLQGLFAQVLETMDTFTAAAEKLKEIPQ